MNKIRLGAFIVAAVAGAGLGLSSRSPSATPGLAEIQRAYDNEAAVAGDKHDKNLKVVGVDCEKDAGPRISCQVGFVEPADFGDRVFLDAALLERKGADWKLLRGLCRRLL
jgi:hypothetical protein